MRSHLAFLLFAFLLLGGTVYPAIGQTSSNDHVVINEVDINPPGDDSQTVTEWVELYNPTDSAVDVGGWEIASTTILKKTFTIPQGTTIKPGGFLTYSYTKIWFTDVSELVQLRDSEGNIIDETPVLTDVSNDFSSWQRLYDGFDTNLTTDWRFGTSSAGSTNGKLIVEEEVAPVSISIEVNKSEFLFGETAYISGIVSENVYIKKPTFQVAPIEIIINGPAFYKPITLFPKFHLDFDTSLKLNPVTGIQAGIYDVTVNYAGATAQTKFSVGNEKIIFAEAEDNDLSAKGARCRRSYGHCKSDRNVRRNYHRPGIHTRGRLGSQNRSRRSVRGSSRNRRHCHGRIARHSSVSSVPRQSRDARLCTSRTYDAVFRKRPKQTQRNRACRFDFHRLALSRAARRTVKPGRPHEPSGSI